MDYTLIAVALISFCVGYWTCYLVGKYLTKEIKDNKPKTIKNKPDEINKKLFKAARKKKEEVEEWKDNEAKGEEPMEEIKNE